MVSTFSFGGFYSVFVCLFVLFSLLTDIRDVDFYEEQYKKLYYNLIFIHRINSYK